MICLYQKCIYIYIYIPPGKKVLENQGSIKPFFPNNWDPRVLAPLALGFIVAGLQEAYFEPSYIIALLPHKVYGIILFEGSLKNRLKMALLQKRVPKRTYWKKKHVVPRGVFRPMAKYKIPLQQGELRLVLVLQMHQTGSNVHTYFKKKKTPKKSSHQALEP